MRFLLLFSMLNLFAFSAVAEGGVRPEKCHLRPTLAKGAEGLTDAANFRAHGRDWNASDRDLYAEFLAGKVDCADLLRRVLKFAWIGDSLSQNFHVSASLLKDLHQARSSHESDLFFDRRDDEVFSLFERISGDRPVYAQNLSQSGSTVATPLTWVDRKLVQKKMLADQVERVLSLEERPDVIGIWLGHNDLDWAADLYPGEDFDAYLERKVSRVASEYVRALDRLVTGLRNERKEIRIFAFGMANVADYTWVARPRIEAARVGAPELYPESERGVYDRFVSLRPENRARLGETFLAMQTGISRAVRAYALRVQRPRNIRVEYLDPLAELDWGDPVNFHPVDGWHLSSVGKSKVAAEIYRAIRPVLLELEVR